MTKETIRVKNISGNEFEISLSEARKIQEELDKTNSLEDLVWVMNDERGLSIATEDIQEFTEAQELVKIYLDDFCPGVTGLWRDGYILLLQEHPELISAIIQKLGKKEE